MAYKIVKANDELEVKSLTSIIFGTPDAGKTSLAFTTNEPFLMDCDNGIHRCVNRKTFGSFENYKDVLEFVNSQDFIDLGIKTLIVDTGGSLLDKFMTSELLKEPKNARGGALSLQGFGQLKATFSSFLNMIKAKGIDIIFICHEKERDEKVRPDLTGSSYDLLMASADLVGRLTFNEKGIRQISFDSTADVVGKNSAGIEKQEIPHFTTPEFTNFFGGLLNKAKDKIKNENKEIQEAQNQIEIFREKINALTEITNRNSDPFGDLKKEYSFLKPIYQISLNKELEQKYGELFESVALEGNGDLESIKTMSTPEECCMFLDVVFSLVKEQSEEYKKACGNILRKFSTALECKYDGKQEKFIPLSVQPNVEKKVAEQKKIEKEINSK